MYSPASRLYRPIQHQTSTKTTSVDLYIPQANNRKPIATALQSQVRYIEDDDGINLRFRLDSEETERAMDMLKDAAKCAWILKQFQNAGGCLEDL